eukprot:scaffold79047_cov64-Phaeocystis_antarctica.AAC.2
MAPTPASSTPTTGRLAGVLYRCVGSGRMLGRAALRALSDEANSACSVLPERRASLFLEFTCRVGGARQVVLRNEKAAEGTLPKRRVLAASDEAIRRACHRRVQRRAAAGCQVAAEGRARGRSRREWGRAAALGRV